jgi:hypothetical protein
MNPSDESTESSDIIEDLNAALGWRDWPEWPVTCHPMQESVN